MPTTSTKSLETVASGFASMAIDLEKRLATANDFNRTAAEENAQLRQRAADAEAQLAAANDAGRIVAQNYEAEKARADHLDNLINQAAADFISGNGCATAGALAGLKARCEAAESRFMIANKQGYEKGQEVNRLNYEAANRFMAERDTLAAQVATLKQHLIWVLPMAKGYAHKSGVESNWRFIEDAENAALAATPDNASKELAELRDPSIALVLDELYRASSKFPEWPTDPFHALAVLGEEFGEVTKEMLQFTYETHKTNADKVRTEAIQCAAMGLRLVMSLDRYEFIPSQQHRP
jgi:hypothetical protein